jgi:hypothetical protein
MGQRVAGTSCIVASSPPAGRRRAPSWRSSGSERGGPSRPRAHRARRLGRHISRPSNTPTTSSTPRSAWAVRPHRAAAVLRHRPTEVEDRDVLRRSGAPRDERPRASGRAAPGEHDARGSTARRARAERAGSVPRASECPQTAAAHPARALRVGEGCPRGRSSKMTMLRRGGGGRHADRGGEPVRGPAPGEPVLRAVPPSWASSRRTEEDPPPQSARPSGTARLLEDPAPRLVEAGEGGAKAGGHGRAALTRDGDRRGHVVRLPFECGAALDLSQVDRR